jgi:phospholipid transport system transporter-binding protein
MAPTASIERLQTTGGGPARLQLRGPLTFATAAAVWRDGLRALEACDGALIEIDCSGIERADSAGLAVLIEWLAWGARRDRQVRLQALPATLVDIARISELEDLLQAG